MSVTVVTEPFSADLNGRKSSAIATRSQARYVLTRDAQDLNRTMAAGPPPGFVRVLLPDTSAYFVGQVVRVQYSALVAPSPKITVTTVGAINTNVHIDLVDGGAFDNPNITGVGLASLWIQVVGIRLEVIVLDNIGVALLNQSLFYTPFDITYEFDLFGILQGIAERQVRNTFDPALPQLTAQTPNNLATKNLQVEYREVIPGATPPAFSKFNFLTLLFAKRGPLKMGGALLWDLLARFGEEHNQDFTTEDYLTATVGWNKVDKGYVMDANLGVITEFTKLLVLRSRPQFRTAAPHKVVVRFETTGGIGGQLRLLSSLEPANPASWTVRDSRNVSATPAARTFQFTPAKNEIWGVQYFGNSEANSVNVLVTITELTLYKRGNFLNNIGVWENWSKKVYFFLDDDYTTDVGNNFRFDVTAADINKTLGAALQATEVIDVSIATNQDLIYNRYIPIQGTVGQHVVTRGTHSATDDDTVMIPQFHEIYRECRNPIMLEWPNVDGGLDQWLFTVNQTLTIDGEGGEDWEKPVISDLEVEGTPYNPLIGVTTVRQSERVLCTAENLTKEQIRRLADIKTAPFVNLWLDKGGNSLLAVKIFGNRSSSLQTDQRTGTFSVEFEMPEDFNLLESLKYDF